VDWLNYHHLYYFSVIAQEGGVASAARKLRLSHSTLSAQLRALEDHFGAALFERRGRRLVLTPFGSQASDYAADIFRMGRELNDVARGGSPSRRTVLRVGVVASVPKTLAHHLLSPAMRHLDPGTAVVRQGTLKELLESLVAGRLHVVLTNEAPSQPAGARLHAHALGETRILLYARAKLARAARRDFPSSLSSLPFVLPLSGSLLRKRIDEWLAGRGVEVEVAAEVEDAGLMRVFGGAGQGVFPVRAVLKTEVEDLSDIELVGPCHGVRERYYAVTTARRLRDAALSALVEEARARLLKVPIVRRK
jgi:LysR family transcriptional activator of nhaA